MNAMGNIETNFCHSSYPSCNCLLNFNIQSKFCAKQYNGILVQIFNGHDFDALVDNVRTSHNQESTLQHSIEQ